MCNRYAVERVEQVKAMFWDEYGAEPPDELAVRYNVAPNQLMPIIATDEAGKAVATIARWNFIPFFEKSDTPKFLRTNARCEEVLAKPSYRAAIQRHRCLVPADRFYEWEHLLGGKVKRPWAFELLDQAPFTFAGLWELATDTRPPTFTILTTTPNEIVGRIHDRMPVMLSHDAGRQWLAPGPLTKETLQPYVVPFPAERMRSYRVNVALNSVRNDYAAAAAPSKADDRDGPIPGDSEPSQGELF